MMKQKVVTIGCDHAGYPYKSTVLEVFLSKRLQIIDEGTHSDESVDYPDFIHPVAENIQQGIAEFGVIICGSGNGVAMTANKHKGIRAAVCWNAELASLARQHNNANVLAIPSRFVTKEVAREMVKTFLRTEFEGGRHARRVDKIAI